MAEAAAETEKPLMTTETGNAPAAAPAFKASAFGMIALGLQVAMTLVFYTAELDLSEAAHTTSSSIYNYYVGVALMMFVGFGYLMSFLKAYGLGAVGLTMYTTCLGVEFAIIVESFMGKHSLTIDFMSLLNGNFAIAAVLISFGGLIGKISPLQITVFTCVELVCYCVNKVFFLGQYMEHPPIADCGGTIIIHVFGAYFGLCACKVLGPPSRNELNASSYTSDLFSLIGTVFLWLFWPSFVAGALDDPVQQTTALINTVLALLASTMTSFAVTPMLMNGLIGTVPIQNATLAGGVSIGAVANLVGPFGAVVIGSLAGILSTWGFVKTPFFADVDTCGIHNLHGMPGVFGGLVSIMVPIFYPAPGVSMLAQAFGLLTTLMVACCTGAVTGFILKMMDTPAEPFTDTSFWECAEDIAKVA